MSTDTIHHPPKSADVGLDPHNQPAGDRPPAAAAYAPADPTDGLGITDLIKNLRDESLHLIRQEVNLAKTEATEKASFFAKQGGKLAAGGAILALGGLLLLLALSYLVASLFQLILPGIEEVFAAALGFLTVGSLITLLGYLLYKKASADLKREPVTPERTIQSLKDDKQWLTNQTSDQTQASQPGTGVRA